MPEEFFSKLQKKIKKEWKIAFLSALVIGFLTHMFVFNNFLPNHDGLISMYSSQFMFTSGRFFLGLSAGISSFFYLQWLNGALSVIYLALTTVVLVEIYNLRKFPAIILTAGLVEVFPVVAATFSYMFTADGYMLGILLATLAILLTKKYKYGFIVGGLILFISVGIYQANFPLVLTIVAVWLIKELIFNEDKVWQIILSLFRYIATTAIGMGLYTILYYIYQKRAGDISSYQGLNQIGKQNAPFVEVIRQIRDTFNEFLFRGFVSDFPVHLYEVLNVLVVALAIIGIVIAFIQYKKDAIPIRMALIVMSLVLLPIFSFILYFVSPGVIYHMLMVYALVPIFLLPIIIYDGLHIPKPSIKVYSWSVVFVSMLTIYNFIVIDNIGYFNMTLKYERSYALLNRVLDRIESTDGYNNETKIAIIGRPAMSTDISSNKVRNNIPLLMGATGEHFLMEPYHFSYMFSNQLGKNVAFVSEDERQALAQSEMVKEMETWPSTHSVKKIGNVIVVKF